MARSSAAGTSRKRRANYEIEEETAQTSPEPQTQRRRLSNDGEDARPTDAEDDLNGDDGTYGGDNGGQDVSADQMVKNLVRLALACEYQRRPIRRAEIGEKVLVGSQGGRRFKEVFMRAQAELKTVFGMEMIELPAKEKVTIAQKRAAAKHSQSAKSSASSSAPTTSWILTSTLPSPFRDPAIISPSAAPTSDEDSKYTALYTTLIALISLSGNSLPDAKLERYLRRLRLTDVTPLDNGRERTERVLKRMEREGYIVRVKETVGTGDDDVYWTVGPRGKVEVGNDGVRGIIQTVFAPASAAEQTELEKRVLRSLGLEERGGTRRNEESTQGNGETTKSQRGRARANGADEEPEDDESDNDEE